MLTTKEIEELSVGAIRKLIMSSTKLDSDIPTNDKSPSWDGEIFLYNEHKSKGKIDIKRRIPVQVKGTKVEEFSNNISKHSFEVSDLRNYYNDNGVILFLVEILNINEFKIFSRSLLPLDLKEILIGIKEKQQKKTIELYETSIDELGIERVVMVFDRNVDKQPKMLVDKQLSIESINKNIKIDFDINNLNKFGDEYYAYSFSDELGIEIPLKEKFKLEGVVQQLEGNISVDEKLYYNNYLSCTYKNRNIIEIGDKIILDFSRNKMLIEKPEGNFLTYINTLYMLRDIADKKHICIKGVKIDVGNKLDKFKIEYKIKMIEDMIKALSMIGVDINEISLKDMDKQSDRNLQALVKGIIYEDTIYIEDTIYKKDGFKTITLTTINICGKKIFIAVEPVGDNEHKIIDVLNNDKYGIFSTDYNGENIRISPYLTIDEEDMDCININWRKAKESIMAISENYGYKDLVNNFMLILLKYYDKSKNLSVLDLSRDLNELYNNYEDDIFKINMYQIIKRKRDLNQTEIKDIINIKKSNSDLEIQCCTNILLENHIEARDNLDNMEYSVRENFKEYPIYNLFRR
ncbi:Uncharacterised protein [[Clostridium] sordellii]|uniref:hypothetical protein n=1 Tax=Paraclostridium sordellii TaxID=1505 RepID=UPI0005E72D77|nr:hypothetical protein [Paeniclostridium sordellii]CEO05456.1 Uncharacterised protein [[Clostridium] sordellii] [Paeniclostridium sordellii]